MATQHQSLLAPEFGKLETMGSGRSDPLDLNDYVSPVTRDVVQNRSMARNTSASVNGALSNSSPTGMPGFNEYAVSYGNLEQVNGTAPVSTPSPMHTLPFVERNRNSVSNLSDEPLSAMTAPLHRTSTGSGDFAPNGLDSVVETYERHGTSSDGQAYGDDNGDDEAAGSGDLDGADPNDPSNKPDKNGNRPAWSEMRTKAGKERKRLPLACIACRRKKIRCSGEKPACKHCLRSRIPCVYKVTTRKAAPRTDYMAMLDKRLKRMEDRVIKLIPRERHGEIAGITRAVVKPPIPGAAQKTPSNKKRQAEEAFGADLDEWAKPKSSAAAERAAQGEHADPEESLLSEGADSLPSKEIQEHLTEIYFDYVYGQSYPLLHKPSFMRRWSAGEIPPVLILAVCAVSARFSTHPQLRTEPAFLRGENWAQRAREIALKRYDTPNIMILIVYLLLGLHEFGTCQGGRSWMFGGMAQRMAFALQLHKDPEYDPTVRDKDRKKLSFIDREIRRRTLWSCFLMDRFNSSGTDRPMFVNEQFIEAQLPIKEEYYQMEIGGPTQNLDGSLSNKVTSEDGQMNDPQANIGVAGYMIRNVCLWGKLVRYMNMGGKEKEGLPMWSPDSTYNAIKRLCIHFQTTLPDDLKFNQENLQNHAIDKTANQFLYLHILHNQVLLFMNRFALPSIAGARPPKDVPHQFLTDCARKALDAANQISILLNESMNYNVVAPFTGYAAFFSSTVHILGVFSKNQKLEATSKQYLAYNVKYLSRIKKYWGMFHFVAENLKDLYRQHADAVRRGVSTTGKDGAEDDKVRLFQYGDWYDRYPHGVSRTDYEDPAAEVKKEPGADAVLGKKSDLQSVEDFFASLSPPSKAEQQRKLAKKAKNSKANGAVNGQSTIHLNTNNMQQAAVALSQHYAQQQHPHSAGPTVNGVHHQPVNHNIAHPLSADALTNTIDQNYLSNTSQPTDPTSYSSIGNLNDFVLSPPGHNGQGPHNLSYTGLNPHDPFNPLGLANGHWSNFDLGGLNSMIAGDPSTAYFMPFNVEPPDFSAMEGVDGNGGQFDMNSGFMNFGDMGVGGPSVDVGALHGHIDGVGDAVPSMMGEGDGIVRVSNGEI